ncbi:MAG: PilW family protein [Halothiobacillaceae bacterium]
MKQLTDIAKALSRPILRNKRSAQSGLTLIELMIALVLGLIIVAGVIQLFLSSKQAYRLQESMSRVQETGRYALEVMSRDIRQAGYKGGCGRDVPVNIILDETDSSYEPLALDLNQPIVGWDGEAGDISGQLSDYVPGTDVVIVKHAATDANVSASGNTPANAANINLTGESGIPKGTIIVVGDAQACDLFQNASNANANNLNRGAPGNHKPGNKKAGDVNFSKSYSGDLHIRSFASTAYYIGTRDDGSRALYRLAYSMGTASDDLNPQVLAPNVLDMQLFYGIDTNGNFRIDEYEEADNVTDWNAVRSVRIALLTVGTDDQVLDKPAKIAFSGGTFSAPSDDRRLYQAFTTTIAIRNQLP